MATPFDISSTIQNYLQAYSGQPTTPQALTQVPTEANLANAPNLESLSTLVNQINQRAQQSANLARTGGAPEYDQAILANIYNMSQGYIAPETVAEAESAAAQQWGGGGFGVDTPAWQSAVRRTLGLTREQQQEKAAQEYATYLQTHPAAPIYDVGQMLVTPQLYETELNRQQSMALELARMQERMEEARAQAYANMYAKAFEQYGKGPTDRILPAYEVGLTTGRVTKSPELERAMQEAQYNRVAAATQAARAAVAPYGWGGTGMYPAITYGGV